LQTNFEFETSLLIRKKIMSSIAIKWRNFKTNLTNWYVYGCLKEKSPCEKYNIDEETWTQFVQSREDPSW